MAPIRIRQCRGFLIEPYYGGENIKLEQRSGRGQRWSYLSARIDRRERWLSVWLIACVYVSQILTFLTNSHVTMGRKGSFSSEAHTQSSGISLLNTKVHIRSQWGNSNNCHCFVSEWYESCHGTWAIIINPMQPLCKWPGHYRQLHSAQAQHRDNEAMPC